MKSIGRAKELQRILRRLDDFRNGRLRWLHMAVASPPHGGLADLLDDVAEGGAAAGDLTVRVTIDDYHQIGRLVEPLNRALQQTLGEVEAEADGSLPTMSALLDRFQHAGERKRKVLLVADVSAALRRLHDEGPVGSGATYPLVSRLRALANKIEDDTLPLAVVIGWDDAIRDWAEVKDVIQRYAPAEMLFADFGLGRKAWPLFKQVFKASGIEFAEDLPGICGAGLPPAAFAEAARASGRPLDGAFVLDMLRRRVDDPSLRKMLSAVPDTVVIKLCLRDEVVPEDSQLGAAVEPLASGGYVATSDLYSALGLVPPREIVSLADSIQQRLDDRDPDLALELGTTIANILADGDAPRIGKGWRVVAAPFFAEKHPLGILEIRLFVALEGGLDADQKAEALAFAIESERAIDGITKLLVIVHHGPRFDVQMRRELVAGLQLEGLENPRPIGEEESKTQGRFIAVLCMVELSTEEVVTAIRTRRGDANDAGLREDLAEKLTHHFRSVLRRMPLLAADLVQAEPLGKLISAAGVPVELSASSAAALSSLNIAAKTEARKHVWRWRSDELLKRISDFEIADQKAMAGYYIFRAVDWPAIGVSLAGSYTADLLAWKNSVLNTVDPTPLLKLHTESRQSALSSMLSEAPTAVKEKFEEQIREALPSEKNADGYELALDKLNDLADRISAAMRSLEEEANRLRDALDKELSKVTAVDDLSSEQAKQLAELKNTQPNKGIIEKARQLSVTVAQDRDRRQQRNYRLEPVRQQIQALSGDNRIMAEQLLRDPKASVEEIRGKVEELRVKPLLQSTTLPPPKANHSETFANSPEDLTRLAELYRNEGVQIVALEVRS